MDGGPLEALSVSGLNPVLPHAIGINKITLFHTDGYKGADVSTQAQAQAQVQAQARQPQNCMSCSQE